jgi:ABC-type transport system involved in cytochrome c biogenesis ATPase subunit
MELFSISVAGYRRFRSQSTLRTNGKLIALLGPNESGKSSLLHAALHLGHTEPFLAGDVSRGETSDALTVQGRFLLSEMDLESSKLTGPRWMTVEKKYNGKRYFGFIPPAPPRNTSHRAIIAQVVLKALGEAQSKTLIEEENEDLPDSLDSLMLDLVLSPPNLDDKAISELRIVLSKLEDIPTKKKSAQLQRATASLAELVVLESAPTPLRVAIDALHQLVPQFLLFDEDQRELASSYQISDLRSSVSPALKGVAEIAELNFSDVFSAIDAGDGGRLTTLEHRANRVLQSKFQEVWRQSGISVALRLHNALIEIQVVNESDEFTGFDERSDGLRQFVALQAFALRSRSKSPVLIIDEAEQRLHYDAQADLVQMLAKQSLAPKVLYTTHSAGCLPEDLGNGVRLCAVDPENKASSIIQNKFWQSDASGFAPLLFGMGASTLAFFPTRRAVLVEGPVDMLLYPSMVREVTEGSAIGFQFVPGLSAASQTLAPLIPSATAHIAYLTDGDAGGLAIKGKLIDAGVPPNRIITLRNNDNSAVEVEDFIDPKLLIRAANNLLSRFHPDAGQLAVSSLALVRRMGSMEVAYEKLAGQPLPKVELAYELLDIVELEPGQPLLDQRRKKAFATTATQIRALFK